MAKHNHAIRERLMYKPNTPLYHEIPKNGYILETTDFVNGTVVVSGGTTNGTAVGEGGGAGLIQRFDVDAIRVDVYPDGKLKSYSPRYCKRREFFDLGYEQPDMTLTGWNGSAGTFTFQMPYTHRWALPRGSNPMDTALNAYAYGSLKHTITTGSITGDFAGCDRAADYSGLVIDVYDRREAQASGNGAVAVVFESDQYIPIPGANSRFPINAGQLPADGAYIDALFITESTANNTLVDTIINKIDVSSGTETWQTMYGPAVKAFNRTMGALVESPANANITGLYYMQIAQDGLLGGAVTPVAFLLDVSLPGTANIDRIVLGSRRVVLPAQFIPKGSKLTN